MPLPPAMPSSCSALPLPCSLLPLPCPACPALPHPPCHALCPHPALVALLLPREESRFLRRICRMLWQGGFELPASYDVNEGSAVQDMLGLHTQVSHCPPTLPSPHDSPHEVATSILVAPQRVMVTVGVWRRGLNGSSPDLSSTTSICRLPSEDQRNSMIWCAVEYIVVV